MTITWPPEPPSNETRKVVVPSGQLELRFVNALSHLSPPDAPPRIERMGANCPLISDVSVGEYVLAASCGPSSWGWDDRGDGLGAFLAKHSDAEDRVLTVARGVVGMGVTKEAVAVLPNGNTQSQFTSTRNPYVGMNQLNELVGQARPGDWCKVEYHAYFAKPKKGKMTGNEEEDLICFTNSKDHPNKLFQIHPSLGQSDYEDKFNASKLPINVTRGLMEGTALLSLGETARIRVSPEYGFSSQGTKAPERDSAKEYLELMLAPDMSAAMDQFTGAYPNVLPHSTLVYDVTLMRICRDRQWHYRKIPPVTLESVANRAANDCCFCLAT